jgi:hypothetical protein
MVSRDGPDSNLALCFTEPFIWRDWEGYAIRDPDSTTHVEAIENAEQFGQRLYVEAWKRGWTRAAQKVVIGAGAEWVWNLANDYRLNPPEGFPAESRLQARWAR